MFASSRARPPAAVGRSRRDAGREGDRHARCEVRAHRKRYQCIGSDRDCQAVVSGESKRGKRSLNPVSGGNGQQKTPSGGTGRLKRVEGVEPSTFTLAT